MTTHPIYDFRIWECSLSHDFLGETPVTGVRLNPDWTRCDGHSYSLEGMCTYIAQQVLRAEGNISEVACPACQQNIQLIAFDKAMTKSWVTVSEGEETTYTLYEEEPTEHETRYSYQAALEKWQQDRLGQSAVFIGSICEDRFNDWEIQARLKERLAEEVKEHHSLTIRQACNIRNEMLSIESGMLVQENAPPPVMREDQEVDAVVIDIPPNEELEEPAAEETESSESWGTVSVMKTSVALALSLVAFICAYVNGLLPFLNSEKPKQGIRHRSIALPDGPKTVY